MTNSLPPGVSTIWSVEYDAAPAAPTRGGLVLPDEAELRALGKALKTTGLVNGPVMAAGAAGLIISELTNLGWRIVPVAES